MSKILLRGEELFSASLRQVPLYAAACLISVPVLLFSLALSRIFSDFKYYESQFGYLLVVIFVVVSFIALGLIRAKRGDAALDTEEPEDAFKEVFQPRKAVSATNISFPKFFPRSLGASFSLEAGDGFGIIGPTGSGKTSLLRVLANVVAPAGGEVLLDGLPARRFSRVTLRRAIGYLPDDLGLRDCTIAEFITRFPPFDAETVISAARNADIHETILLLRDGYETRLLDLPRGLQQRIGLARALYGEPFLVALDEPNSNLDSQGDSALTRAIEGVRGRGGIVIVITHRPSALAALNKLAIMRDGLLMAIGPKDEILRNFLGHTVETASVSPLRA